MHSPEVVNFSHQGRMSHLMGLSYCGTLIACNSMPATRTQFNGYSGPIKYYLKEGVTDRCNAESAIIVTCEVP